MADESGDQAGSEASLSSEISHSNAKPCEICGSNANENLIMICFRCNETREHTYCARVMLPSVPPMWLCEECREVLLANQRANQVAAAVDSEDSTETIDQNAQFRTTNQVVNNQDPIEAGPSSSRTDQVEQVVDNATTSSPVVPRVHTDTTSGESSST